MVNRLAGTSEEPPREENEDGNEEEETGESE
jgi:hypothetical protein